MVKRTSAIFIILTLLTAITSACDSGNGGVDGAQVIRDMQKKVSTVKSTHANLTIHINLKIPTNIDGDINLELWQRSPADVRAEISKVNIAGLDALIDQHLATPTPDDSGYAPAIATITQTICPATGKPIVSSIDGPDFTPSDLQGATLVTNGETTWLYTPATCQAYTMSAASAETTPAQMQMLIDNIPGMVDKLLEVADAKGIGVEQVGDRAAYRVELTAKPDLTSSSMFSGGKATLWVDKERSLPLKLDYNINGFGQITVTVLNLETNQVLDDKLFAFSPPRDAVVVDVDAQTPRNTTVPEARQHADYPILVPSYLPGDAVLIGVKQLRPSQPTPNKETVTFLNYQGSINFDIIESKGGQAGAQIGGPIPTQPANSNTESISLRDVTATLITFTDPNGKSHVSLYWNDKLGTTINIRGDLSREEVLKVAASLKEGE